MLWSCSIFRLLGFGACLLGAAACFFVAFLTLPLLAIRPAKFALAFRYAWHMQIVASTHARFKQSWKLVGHVRVGLDSQRVTSLTRHYHPQIFRFNGSPQPFQASDWQRAFAVHCCLFWEFGIDAILFTRCTLLSSVALIGSDLHLRPSHI